MRNHYMTIDPGLPGSGFAMWDEEYWKAQIISDDKLLCNKPEYHAVHNFKSTEKYLDQIIIYIKMFQIKKVWIENAAYMGGSAKGQMVADTGRLIKLAKFVGAIEAVCWTMSVPCIPVEVKEWKGTLPKDVCNHRILRVWPECDCKSHDWDAVGIGMYLMGLINQRNK